MQFLKGSDDAPDSSPTAVQKKEESRTGVRDRILRIVATIGICGKIIWTLPAPRPLNRELFRAKRSAIRLRCGDVLVEDSSLLAVERIEMLNEERCFSSGGARDGSLG